MKSLLSLLIAFAATMCLSHAQTITITETGTVSTVNILTGSTYGGYTFDSTIHAGTPFTLSETLSLSAQPNGDDYTPIAESFSMGDYGFSDENGFVYLTQQTDNSEPVSVIGLEADNRNTNLTTPSTYVLGTTNLDSSIFPSLPTLGALSSLTLSDFDASNTFASLLTYSQGNGYISYQDQAQGTVDSYTVSVAPEPNSFLLLLTGLAGFGVVSYVRRRIGDLLD
jgi:hypothetical protein